MVSAIRRGVLDLIGAARPSIADPFLPTKIKEGRIEDIRECIGCNICVTGDTRYVPIRCTQNPTMGEEWRRGWHPEIIAPKKSDKEIMVIGAGPAGLEAARVLGQRGYEVSLLEARKELGGRVLRESGVARTQRMAARNGLALDPDQENEKHFRLSIQPDDLLKRFSKAARRISSLQPAQPGGAMAWDGRYRSPSAAMI